MTTTMERPRDVVGGLLVTAIGAGFLLFGRELEIGTSFRMGPGYFPTILSVLMIGLGLAMTALAWRGPREEGGVRPGALAGAPAGGRCRWCCSASPCAAWAWHRSWSWWCWPRPGPAATPACAPRCRWRLGIAAFCSFLFIKGAGPAFAPVRTLGQPGAIGLRLRRPPRPPPRRRSRSSTPWNCSPIWAWASRPRSVPWNLLYAFVGCLLGTAVGVLPGLGPVATIAMLLPLTFSLPPVSALIMLAGIYYGAQYGGSTTAILINLPGRILLGGDRDRRLSDGQAGPRRTGAGDRGPGLVLRRLRWRR